MAAAASTAMVELAGDTIKEEFDFSHFFSSLVFFSHSTDWWPGLAWLGSVGLKTRNLMECSLDLNHDVHETNY